METKTDNTNEVYHHFGRVVLMNKHGTQYMSMLHARTLAKELRALSKAIEFGKHIATRRIENGEAFNVSNLAKKRISI